MSLAADTAPGKTPDPTAATGPRQPLQAQLADILDSLRRLADLQIALVVTGVKMAVVRVVLLAVLALLALLLALVALIFLYAGIYHVLTDIILIPTAWSLLIFAGVHLLLAGVLVVAGLAVVNRRHRRHANPGAAP